MDFFQSQLWWVLVSVGAVLCFVIRFGHHGRGTLSPLIGAIGFIGLLAVGVVTFFVIGWDAFIAVAILAVLFAFLSDLILWQLFRLHRQAAKDIAFKQFLKRDSIRKAQNDWTWTTESREQTFEHLRVEDERMNSIVKKISRQPEVLRILERYGKQPQDVIEIKNNLASRTGTIVAEDAVQTPKLLELYLHMAKDEEEPETIAARILLALGL